MLQTEIRLPGTHSFPEYSFVREGDPGGGGAGGGKRKPAKKAAKKPAKKKK